MACGLRALAEERTERGEHRLPPVMIEHETPRRRTDARLFRGIGQQRSDPRRHRLGVWQADQPVLAIACGVVDGLALGQNARAALIARGYADMGGDAVIASDPGLILALAETVPGLRIHVSSVATCRNADGARLYQELGARRLILPRDITLDEAAEISAAVPDLEIEAFVLNDGCVYEEGSCNTLHLPGALGGPICLDRYAYDHRHRDGRPLSTALAARLEENDAAYRRWLWYRFSCGFTTTAEGMPFGPCGLCAIPALGRGGIHALKIAGREGPPERKLASVRMVRQILDAHERGELPAAVMARARDLRPSHEHCATGFMCYYPEVVAEAQRTRETVRHASSPSPG